MLKFIHLTEPHLVPAPRPPHALDLLERLARAADNTTRPSMSACRRWTSSG